MKGIFFVFRMEVKYFFSKVYVFFWKFLVSFMIGVFLWQGKVWCMVLYLVEMLNV